MLLQLYQPRWLSPIVFLRWSRLFPMERKDAGLKTGIRTGLAPMLGTTQFVASTSIQPQTITLWRIMPREAQPDSGSRLT